MLVYLVGITQKEAIVVVVVWVAEQVRSLMPSTSN